MRCNAPEFSAVVGADGRVAPCFFIPGTGVTTDDGLRVALGDAHMVALRAAIRAGARQECARCVCSMWRDPASFATDEFQLSERLHA